MSLNRLKSQSIMLLLERCFTNASYQVGGCVIKALRIDLLQATDAKS